MSSRRHLKHPQVATISMSVAFRCVMRCSLFRYAETDAKCAQIILELRMFTISKKECAFPHNNLDTSYSGKQTPIRDDLNLYVYHIQIKDPKRSRSHQLGLQIVRNSLVDPSPSWSRGGVAG